MSRRIEAVMLIPGRVPADVWPLLTQASQLARWFAGHAEVDLSRGHLTFWGDRTPDVPAHNGGHITLLAAQAPGGTAPGQLAFAWQLRGQRTEVEITLTAAAGGVQVSVVHTALSERLTSKASIHDFWYTALENLRLLALTGRPQSLPQYGASASSTILVAVDIAAPAAEVFRYISEPEAMALLWEDRDIRVDLRPGGVYDYGWGTGGPLEVVEVDPPHLLSFTWRYPPETSDSLVTWRLAEHSGVTTVSLEHSGIAADTTDNEEYRAGWFSFLAIIKGIVELKQAWSRVRITGSAHGEA